MVTEAEFHFISIFVHLRRWDYWEMMCDILSGSMY